MYILIYIYFEHKELEVTRSDYSPRDLGVECKQDCFVMLCETLNVS
jgi:hypothetical protein